MFQTLIGSILCFTFKKNIERKRERKKTLFNVLKNENIHYLICDDQFGGYDL